MTNNLQDLIGKIVTGEAKKPRGDIRDFALEISHILSLPTRNGQETYVFATDKDGRVGLHNVSYWFADTLTATTAVNFIAQPLDGWFVVPSEDGVVNPHFAWCEKVSERAQKRLPANAIKLADCILK